MMTRTRFCRCCGQPIPSAVERAVETLHWPPMERTILDCFVERFGKDVTYDALVARVYGGRIDGGPNFPEDVLKVAVSHMRRRLAPLGLTITNVRGQRTRRLVWVDEKQEDAA